MRVLGDFGESEFLHVLFHNAAMRTQDERQDLPSSSQDDVRVMATTWTPTQTRPTNKHPSATLSATLRLRVRRTPHTMACASHPCGTIAASANSASKPQSSMAVWSCADCKSTSRKTCIATPPPAAIVGAATLRRRGAPRATRSASELLGSTFPGKWRSLFRRYISRNLPVGTSANTGRQSNTGSDVQVYYMAQTRGGAPLAVVARVRLLHSASAFPHIAPPPAGPSSKPSTSRSAPRGSPPMQTRCARGAA